MSVPVAPFTVHIGGRECHAGIESDGRAATLAVRLVRRGAKSAGVRDVTGWLCGIYERAERPREGSAG